MAGYAGVRRQSAHLAGYRQLGLHGLGARKRIRRGHSQEVYANPLRPCSGRGVGGVDTVLMPQCHHQETPLAKEAGSIW
jgi:hypothetical protein